MTSETDIRLKRGWTTGACATAASKAALYSLWSNEKLDIVSIKLPKGETPVFNISYYEKKKKWVDYNITRVFLVRTPLPANNSTWNTG